MMKMPVAGTAFPELVVDAEAFARAAHADHTRKDAARSPYAVHLEEVAGFVSRHGGDPAAVAAAWLHDTVEDAAACALHSQAGADAPDAKRYEVFVDDNFHFMDESERVAAGSFATIEEAVEKCREIVLNDLRHLLEWKPHLTAKELAGEWSAWGEDPWIRGGAFSAREFVDAMSPSLVAERARRETEAGDGAVDGSMAE